MDCARDEQWSGDLIAVTWRSMEAAAAGDRDASDDPLADLGHHSLNSAAENAALLWILGWPAAKMGCGDRVGAVPSDIMRRASQMQGANCGLAAEITAPKDPAASCMEAAGPSTARVSLVYCTPLSVAYRAVDGGSLAHGRQYRTSLTAPVASTAWGESGSEMDRILADRLLAALKGGKPIWAF
jgi:hypothetical protein